MRRFPCWFSILSEVMVAKRRKTKAKGAARPLDEAKRARLTGWLEKIGEAPEEALVRLVETASVEPDLALAMLRELGRKAVPEAGWVADRAGRVLEAKALRKEAKKTLYRLEQKGIRPKGGAAPKPIFKAVGPEPPFGFLSGYYPDNSQTLSLAFPMVGGEGFCGAAVCHFEKGIVEIGMAPMSLAKFRKMNYGMSDDLPWPQIRLETEDLAFVLDSALKTHRAARGGMGEEIMFLIQWLEGREEVPPQAPIYGRLEPGAKPGGDYGPRLEKLLALPPCLWWYPDQERWAAAGEMRSPGRESGLILSPGLEAERAAKDLADISEVLFPEESWPSWRARLEEAALFMVHMGQEDEAKVFLSAAQDLDRPDHPLFKGLIGKMKDLEQELKETPEPGVLTDPAGETGLILPPGLGKVES